MADEQKTRPTGASVAAFLAAVEHPGRRTDAQALCRLFEAVSGERAAMWGPSIVGFGRYHYRYASGHEGDAPRLGFSPRKANMVVYIMPGFERRPDLIAPFKGATTGVSCLYLKRLGEADFAALRALAEWTLEEMRRLYPED